jgi:predicted RND superfamily exporter protein
MLKVKLSDPAALRELAHVKEDIENIPETKIVISIIDDIAQFAKEYPLSARQPKTEADAKLALEKIKDSGVAPETLAALYREDTVKFTIFNSAVLNTAQFREYWRKIEDLLQERHPNLKYYFGGKPLLWSLQDQMITKGKPINVATSEVMLIFIRALMVFLTLWTVQRFRQSVIASLTNGVVMTVPLLFASAVLVVLMVAASWKLDQANAAIMALALNASIDLSVYWMDTYQRRRQQGVPWREAVKAVSKEEARPLFDDVVVNILIFSPLIFSHFGPIRVLGTMLAAMLLATLYGTMVFMPAVLGIGSWRRKNKKQ